MENNFNQLMNWTYLPTVLVYAKDSKKKKKKLRLMSVLARELVKLNDKSNCIILEQVHCTVSSIFYLF